MEAPDALSTAAVLELATRAEDLGFDSLWVGDHIQWHQATLDSLCVLSALAVATRTARLGTSVLLLPLRHPVLVAKAAATIDHLCGGRLVLGLGLGTDAGGDYSATGIEPRTRGKRMDDSLRVLQPLLRGEVVDHESAAWKLSQTVLSPSPVQEAIPLLFGGHSVAALRRVANSGQGWIAAFTPPSRLREQLVILREECQRAGRDSGELEVLVIVYVERGPDEQTAVSTADGYVRRQYRIPASRLAPYSAFGPKETIERRLDEYLEAGATGFIFAYCGPRYLETTEFVAEAVNRRLA